MREENTYCINITFVCITDYACMKNVTFVDFVNMKVFNSL